MLADLCSLTAALQAQEAVVYDRFCSWARSNSTGVPSCQLLLQDADLTQYTLDKGVELRAMMSISDGVELLTQSGQRSPVQILVGRQLLKLVHPQAGENRLTVVYFTGANSAADDMKPEPLVSHHLLHLAEAVLLRVDVHVAPQVAAPCALPMAQNTQQMSPCIQLFRKSRRVSLLRGSDTDLVALGIENVAQLSAE